MHRIPWPSRPANCQGRVSEREILPGDGGPQQQQRFAPFLETRKVQPEDDTLAVSPSLYKLMSVTVEMRLNRQHRLCIIISRSNAPCSSTSSSHSASSNAVLFLLTGITRPTTPFATSNEGESNGTSCEGNGSAAEEEDRAEEGTNSVKSRSETSEFNSSLKGLTFDRNHEVP